MRKARTGILLSLFVALGCEKPTAPEVPLPLPLTDRIVFQSDRADPLGDIYAMTLDGAEVTRLTRSSAGETCPNISPDGNWIAYYSNVGDPRNSATVYTLQLMRANGTGAHAIAAIGQPHGCPLWSRASDAIQATSNDVPSLALDAASERTRVFELSGNEVASFPGWTYSIGAFSADGTEFLITQGNCGRNGCTLPDLLVAKRDGTWERWLTGGGSGGSFIQDGAQFPSLSPDGATVVFICRDSVSSGLSGLCTIKWDGTGKTQLASNAWSSPRFSPNATRISFSCGAPPPTSLCVMDGSGANLLTWPVNEVISGADWTPDGTGLVFDCGGGKDICAMGADAGVVTNLTLGKGTNVAPSMPWPASR
jgi:WD40-like Beta Propeller Repeat